MDYVPQYISQMCCALARICELYVASYRLFDIFLGLNNARKYDGMDAIR